MGQRGSGGGGRARELLLRVTPADKSDEGDSVHGGGEARTYE